MRSLVCLLALVGCDRVFGLDDPHLPSTSDDAAIDAPRPDGEPAGCPTAYSIRLQTTASLYRLETSTASWTTAAADCADDGPGLTHLIVLSNEAERAALITLPATYLVDDTWIGASDRKTSNKTYQWVTTENTAGYVVPASLGASPWEIDQPDLTSGCGELRALSGSLHDESCGSSSNYLCECDGRANDSTRY